MKLDPITTAAVKLRILRFLVADTQLYRRLCQSVGPSVREHESKSGETRVLEAFCEPVRGVRYGWGLDAPAHPSATIL